MSADDLIRDVTAYSRFLSAALDLRSGTTIDEQGIDEIPASATLKQGDDYVRGEDDLSSRNAQAVMALRRFGTVDRSRVICAGARRPESWSMQSRNYFPYDRQSCRASSAATCRWAKNSSATRNAATSRITSATCRAPRVTAGAARWRCAASC